MRDEQRRNVFVWDGRSPEARSLTEMFWELIEEPEGLILRNIRYDEYLYAAADDLAIDDGNRSVFTWKTRDDLGVEGHWKIWPAICPGMKNYFA